MPRAGTYNVTVAGAAGGTGICNVEFGRGLVVTAQLNITEDHRNLLILVGQRGISPCSLSIFSLACLQIPHTFNESATCNQSWFDLLRATNLEELYSYIGGGGGGGASMIRYADNPELLPPVVAAGGGGSSAVLSYDAIAVGYSLWNEKTNASIELGNSSTNIEAYREHLNAKRVKYDPRFVLRPGVRGVRVNDAATGFNGGAGGGYYIPEISQSPRDGESLDSRFTFAAGGIDCASDFQLETYLGGALGGFGGGGGGCGTGGGGGGFTGGNVLGFMPTVPGGGGYSEVSDGSTLMDVPADNAIAYNHGDGYVQLVPANCGCADECVLYEEEEMFECCCANGTTIAPDQSDCYHSTFHQQSNVL